MINIIFILFSSQYRLHMEFFQLMIRGTTSRETGSSRHHGTILKPIYISRQYGTEGLRSPFTELTLIRENQEIRMIVVIKFQPHEYLIKIISYILYIYILFYDYLTFN